MRMRLSAGVKYMMRVAIVFGAMQMGRAAEVVSGQKTQVVSLYYEPEIVRVEGTVCSKESYGAPNYDETSPKERWYCLLLKQKVNVIGSKSDDQTKQLNEDFTVANIGEMQLVLCVGGEALLGKTVIIYGTLSHAITGHHHAQILLEPLKIYCLTPYH